MYNGKKIAVITANYNNGRYFDSYIKGLMTQYVKPDAVFFADDKSTDDSREVVLARLKSLGEPRVENGRTVVWLPNGIRFHLIECDTNGGPAKARNAAITAAKNTDAYYAYCVYDSDDVYYPAKIRNSIDVMAKYRHVGLVYSDYDTYNELLDTTTREYKEIYSYDRLAQECIVSNNSVVLASIIDKVGLYDESLFGPEDYDMWMRISDICAIYHIPEALYMYRISGSNLTITTPSNRFAQHVARAHQKAAERRNAKK